MRAGRTPRLGLQSAKSPTRFHISKMDSRQTEIYEPPEEFRRF